MEWVAIDVNIAGNSVTHRLAEACKIRVAEAVGLLALTFAGMAQHAEDGDLIDVTDGQLEEWARWHGKRGVYARLFRAQLCEGTVVRKWDEYNGAHIKEAMKAKERMQDYRAKKKAEREAQENANRARTVTPENANGNANSSRTVTPNSENGSRDVRHNRTGQDSTRERTNLSPTLSANGGKGAEPLEFSDALKTPDVGDAYAAAWLERYGYAMRHGRSRAQLVALERDHDPADVLARWTRYLAATDAAHASATRFAKHFDDWRDGGPGASVASGSTTTDEAGVLWLRYVAADLLVQWPRQDYQRIGEELVAAGHYPTVEAFSAEIRITQPWTLNTARMTDDVAVKVIGDRLRAARVHEATP